MTRILIIDDSVLLRRTMRQMILAKFPSVHIIEAGNGKEAMDHFKVSPPNLVFLDFRLPGANGFELARKINSSYPHVVIVMFTNNDMPEYREKAFRSGAHHFVSKNSSKAEDITSLVSSIIKAQ